MRICIAGGGALGHVIAGYIAGRKGVDVSILTRHPQDWEQSLNVFTPEGETILAHLDCVTSDPNEACKDADIVLICLPGFAIEEELKLIAPYLNRRTWIGSVVSSSGFFFDALRILDSKQPLFGFQRVPFISRVKEYGHSAMMLGKRSSLNIAVEQYDNKEEIRSTIEQLFYGPVNLLGSHYEVSLTNSNPLLHTSRLYTMWKDYNEGIVYDLQPQFYYDWTDETSQLLIAMDEEFQRLCKCLPIRKGAIPPLLEYYESTDVASMTRKITSIPAFAGLLAPMIEVDGGYIPNFGSRYFTEDFPYGLKIIHDLAHENGVEVPMIDKVYEWGMSKI